MNRDYKCNKSELTRLRRQEKLYEHYLPVLTLKQEQLHMESNRIRNHLDDARRQHTQAHEALLPYLTFFADEHDYALDDVLRIDALATREKSIAGAHITTFLSLTFKPIDLNYFHTSPWLIRSLPLLKNYLHCEIALRFLTEEQRIIKQELRKASQKVNLFDQVLIPTTKDAIKRIKIALGDEQVAMVSRGKIAQAKKKRTIRMQALVENAP